jgi:hypothetical protein
MAAEVGHNSQPAVAVERKRAIPTVKVLMVVVGEAHPDIGIPGERFNARRILRSRDDAGAQ